MGEYVEGTQVVYVGGCLNDNQRDRWVSNRFGAWQIKDCRYGDSGLWRLRCYKQDSHTAEANDVA